MKKHQSTSELRFRYGTPPFHKWRGQWKSSPTDSDCSEVEYEQLDNALNAYFLSAYPKSGEKGFIFLEDFYTRGDFNGDRTLVIEINNPKLLTLEFINELQNWLRQPQYESCRIAVPTYLSDKEVILVYPAVIRISEKYEQNLRRSLQIISSQMKDYSTRTSPFREKSPNSRDVEGHAPS